jgi:hypothetical protein
MDASASGAVAPVIAGSIDCPLSVGVSMTSPLVVAPATELTVGDGLEKACSNSRRAKAASAHSAGVWAGWPGAVPDANGLRTASTTLETISATVLTGVVTAAAVVVAVAGFDEMPTSGAMSIVAAVGTGVVAAADPRAVVGVWPASATTRVASTLLAGVVVRAACVFAAAALRVVFAAVVPDVAGAVVGCAGAVASVESGSDPPAGVAAVPADWEEPVGELVSAPPVLTTTPRSAERVGGCDDADEVSDADFDVT